MNWFTTPVKGALGVATSITKALIQEEDEIRDVSFGVTPSLIEFVQNICEHPKTFTDFPLDSGVSDTLTSWQEQHAKLMLHKVPELSQLRNQICPSRMKDGRFWTIYFLLVRNKCPVNEIATPPASPASLALPTIQSTNESPVQNETEVFFETLFQETLDQSFESYQVSEDILNDNYFDFTSLQPLPQQ